MSELKKVLIFSDGACSGNPGPGGWGAILKYGDKSLEISGGECDTTNNRMELTAVIQALKKLNQPCDLVITTDSKYVCDAYLKNWISNWKSKNWKKSDGSSVLNPDLWKELDNLLSIHKFEFVWVKGHAGHPENEKCDKLATSKIEEYK